ncbi:cytochrome c biogenesis protein [Bacteroidia bacterium]|nr:cytochrome c biogenesis protein [Bacteroidia bacterium]
MKNSILPKLPFYSITALIVVMATATFLEKEHGTSWVYANIYGTWWFSGLWGIVAVAGIIGIVKGRLYKNGALFLLHFSFILILTGALCTKLFSQQGYVVLDRVHLCEAMQTDEGLTALPFVVQLDTFYVAYYPGTNAPSDYISHFSISDKTSGQELKGQVSMNRIFRHQGYRFYQSSFEEDGNASVLSLNKDVWGIPLTYTGYALFVVAMIWFLFSPKNVFRKLLSSLTLKKPLLMLGLFIAVPAFGQVMTPDSLSINRQYASEFGKLVILYNGRMMPVATFAHDFTLKLTGKTSFGYLDANQFLAGFLFFPERWQQVALFDVKDGELKKLLNAEREKAALQDFYDAGGGYKLSKYWKDLSRQGARSPQLKEIEKLNDKIQLIGMLHAGSLLQIYPQHIQNRVQWYYPTQDLNTDEEQRHLHVIRHSLLNYYQAIKSNDARQTDESLQVISDFQQQNAGDILPSEWSREVEIFYMKANFSALLFKVNLTLGLLALLSLFLFAGKKAKTADRLFYVLLAASLTVHTVSIALRTYIAGRLPFGNGYETMLLIAWSAMFLAVLFGRKIRILLSFGYLLSGCTLLVACIGTKNPQITPLVPVLSSPLLSLHVSTIMVAYTLFGFIFLNSLIAIIQKSRMEQQQTYSLICLYPALLFLGAGIFLGAVWANISWGRYWGWDPKEVWALITFLLYSLPIHQRHLSLFAKPLYFHCYCIVAFLSVLITYFGVNYFLGGMHSYAG